MVIIHPYNNVFNVTNYGNILITINKLYQNPNRKQKEICTLQLGHLSLNFRAMPVTVPPVPAPITTMSTLSEINCV